MSHQKFIQRYCQIIELRDRDISPEAKRRLRLRMMKAISLLLDFIDGNEGYEKYEESLMQVYGYVRGWPYVPGPRLPTIASVKKINKMRRSLF